MRYLSVTLAVSLVLAWPAEGAGAQAAPLPVAADSSRSAAGAVGAEIGGAATEVPERYVPHRAFDAKRNRFSDFEAMVAELAKADVIFLGEQHDDPRTHRLQLAVLEGLGRRLDGKLVLSLEMFERDVQPALDAYLDGSAPLASFLAVSRPWPNNRLDYQPMVDYAKDQGWPVVAANVPRRLAQQVSRRGLAAVDSLSADDRAFVAADLSCPRDDYWKRFRETMGDMSGHGMQMTPEQADAMVQRFYEAQCVKDETMAEAIARASETHGAPVVHMNGAFHSDHRLGTVSRVKRRLTKARIAVVTFVPVADLDRANGKSRRKVADWIVFTLETPKPPRDSTP